MGNIQQSFIREIMRLTTDPTIISFAGGWPNPQFFPTEAIALATESALRLEGPSALQYQETQGHLPLREYIADRYERRFGLAVDPSEILITAGSQQGLDLTCRVILDPGDRVVVESPSYLGAFQTIGMFEAVLRGVPLLDDGVDVDVLREAIAEQPKLLYAIPSFQNPSGISYSEERRQAVAELLRGTSTYLVEDDPYGELSFRGEHIPPIKAYLPERTILLGSFSKTIAPGLRLGWACAPRELLDKMVIAKQACDLHTSSFVQHVVTRYLADNDFTSHVEVICSAYRRRRDIMLDMIERHLPTEVRTTRPEGGMFLWATLPGCMSAMAIFKRAIREKVAFVPGAPFHVNGGGDNALRLSYVTATEEQIEEGIRRLGGVMDECARCPD